MKKRGVILLLRFLILGVAVYAGLCLFLFLVQRRMIYQPSRTRAVLPEGFTEWMGANGEFWGFKRVWRGGGNNGEVLFFFHGNGGNASGWSHAVEAFPGDIFVLEYPGYGERSGSPSERSIKEAALRAFEGEQGKYGSGAKVVLAGQSLGTGVTVEIFERRPERLHALVLITPFTSLGEVAGAHFSWFPTRWLVRDRLPLYEAFMKFPGKSVVVTAADDEIIPRAHSLKFLAATNGNRVVMELPSMTHNGIDLDADFWRKVLEGKHWTSADKSNQKNE